MRALAFALIPLALSACSTPTAAPEQAPVEQPQPATPATAPAAEGTAPDSDVRTNYGEFVRFELVTAAPDEAAKFYGSLFGWTVQTVDQQTRLTKNGMTIASVRRPGDDGVPTGWMSWISVAEIDDLMRDVGANGGEVVVPPKDGADGRAAILRGPTGGVFGAIQLENPADSGKRPQAGEFTLCQLWTPDFETARTFYRVIGNYTSLEVDFGTTRYSVLRGEDDEPRALIRQSPDGVGARWVPFVLADDVDAKAEAAKSLGATIITAPREIPTLGRVAVVQAPTGGVFGLIAADVWDD